MSLNDDKRSQELDDSDLDKVAGGFGDMPPPSDDGRDPGDGLMEEDKEKPLLEGDPDFAHPDAPSGV